MTLSKVTSPSSLKIGLLTITYPPDVGGVAIAVQRLAHRLCQQGHRVVIFVPAGQTSSVTLNEPENGSDGRYSITVKRMGPYKRQDDLQAATFDEIVREHSNQPFDLLHGYYVAGTGFLTTYVGRYLEIPTIVSARGNDLDRALFLPEQGGNIRWALENSAGVTAVSNELARKIKALVPAREPTVIHNGVNTVLFQPAAPDPILRESLGIPAESSIVGFVGEARPKKGINSLLLAFVELEKRWRERGLPAPSLLLVGGFRPKHREMRTLFEARYPDSRLIIAPYRQHADLPAYYNLIDVLALPSERDGLPNSLLEGMACARPIVTTQVGGIGDVVTDGENGCFVPVRDSQSLADSLAAILEDPVEAKRLGESGRTRVVEYFPVEKELDQVLALYHKLLKRHSD